jgi:hypothetical protein
VVVRHLRNMGFLYERFVGLYLGLLGVGLPRKVICGRRRPRLSYHRHCARAARTFSNLTTSIIRAAVLRCLMRVAASQCGALFHQHRFRRIGSKIRPQKHVADTHPPS